MIKVTLEFETIEEVAAWAGAGVATPEVVSTEPAPEKPAATPKKKRGRKTKAQKEAEAKAAAEAEAAAAAEEEDPFALDDEPEETVTKENVRDALIKYQTALKASLIAGGTDEDEAKTEAMNTARGLLSEAGGADTLGALDEASYAAVVKAADAATAKL